MNDMISGLGDVPIASVTSSALDSVALINQSPVAGRQTVVGGLKINRLKSVLALRRPNPFWYHPYVGSCLSDLPRDLDESFFEADPAQSGELGEIHFLLWETDDGAYGCLVPMANGDRRSYLKCKSDSISFVTRFDADFGPEKATGLIAFSSDPYSLVQGVSEICEKMVSSFRRRISKRLPEFVDLFGWCTWDAFYQDVSESGIENGLKGFDAGGAQLGFLMIDDGWQDVDHFKARSFGTNRATFPNGLRPLVEKAKSEYGLKMVGVWHALQGYWHGVSSRGPMADRYAISESASPSSYFDLWGEQFGPASRGVVDPADIYRWYQEFYAVLAGEGIGMVKVDNQAMLDFFVQEKWGRTSTMLAYQQALQGASQARFEGNLINCMSNSNDVAFSLSSSSVWRNSDDFYPSKPPSKQALHVYCNAINSIWTGEFALCDWDMFQSTHEAAVFHAMARAISGGPVYVSDKVGEHDFDLIGKLTLTGGRTIRFPEPARPTIDSMFTDPLASEAALKVFNQHVGVGLVGIFNCHSDIDESRFSPVADVSPSGTLETEKDASDNDFELVAVKGFVSSSDVYGLSGKRFAYYGHERGMIGVAGAEGFEFSLPPMGSELVTISPVENGAAVLGLIDKYNAPGALNGWEWLSKHWLRLDLKDGGLLGVHCSCAPASVRSRHSELSFEYDANDCLLRVEVPRGDEVRVDLKWSGTV